MPGSLDALRSLAFRIPRNTSFSDRLEIRCMDRPRLRWCGRAWGTDVGVFETANLGGVCDRVGYALAWRNGRLRHPTCGDLALDAHRRAPARAPTSELPHAVIL
jgi:hypothetical protein